MAQNRPISRKKGKKVSETLKGTRKTSKTDKKPDNGFKNNFWIYLGIIFIICTFFRSYIALQEPYYSDDQAYFNLRQIEHIKDTGAPLISDPLSYGGKLNLFSPLFHYLMAGFSFVFPDIIAFKIMPNLIASTVIFAIFLITFRLTRSAPASLLSATLGGFVPVFLKATTNSLSVLTLVAPMAFYLIYCFMRIEEERYLNHFIIISFLLPLVHPTAFLFLLGLLFYFILARLQSLRLFKRETEVIIFSFFLIFWVEFLIYKKAFLMHGINVIWQNIPTQILGQHFQQVSIIEVISLIGIIPFIFGMYAIYKYLFIEKSKNIYIVSGFTIAIAALTLFKLVTMETGLLFLGLILTILFGLSFARLNNKIRKTKVPFLRVPLNILIIILLLLTSFIPAYVYAFSEVKESTAPGKIEALGWIGQNVDNDEIVIAPLQEGHMVNYITKKKNLIDSNFLLARDVQFRYDDLTEIYSTRFRTGAIMIFEKYGARYIIFDDVAAETYDIEGLNYVEEDDTCFEVVFRNDDMEIFRNNCILETVGRNPDRDYDIERLN